MKLTAIRRKRLTEALFALALAAATSGFPLSASIKSDRAKESQEAEAAAANVTEETSPGENAIAPIRTGNYPAMTLEIPDTPLVQKYRTMYTSPDGLKWLQAVIKRPMLYRDFIRTETIRQDVPECHFYQPVIESGFTHNAVSS